MLVGQTTLFRRLHNVAALILQVSPEKVISNI